jgi:Sec-independent protein translocase protein TatA
VIVGFGAEILFILMLGLLVPGPKQLHAMLGYVARAKGELENITGRIKSQLGSEFDTLPRKVEADWSRESVGGQ